MTGWLLDITIVSELRRPKPEPKVLTFVAAQPVDRLFVSAVTLAEIRSVVETGRRRSIRAIDAIRLTLNADTLPQPKSA